MLSSLKHKQCSRWIFIALAVQGILFVFGAGSVNASTAAMTSTTGSETVRFGAYSTSNWRSTDFKGSASRQWDQSGASFAFVWNTENGDQIGRIGVSYGSSYLGVKIDDIRSDCVMSTKALYTPVTDHWFYWAIYGWTHGEYTYWGNTAKGWNNEFYIIFYTDKTKEAFLADEGSEAIGCVDVDGVLFDCYKRRAIPKPQWMAPQWIAVCRSKTWSASVNLRKIFDYWRAHGLANEYVVDLGWALEGFSGSAGKLQLTDVHIPDLTSANPAVLRSALPPTSTH